MIADFSFTLIKSFPKTAAAVVAADIRCADPATTAAAAAAASSPVHHDPAASATAAAGTRADPYSPSSRSALAPNCTGLCGTEEHGQRLGECESLLPLHELLLLGLHVMALRLHLRPLLLHHLVRGLLAIPLTHG